MKTFTKEKKDLLLAEIEKHRLSDQILQGTYGTEKDGKWRGCAVGCSIHSLNILEGKEIETDNHKAMNTSPESEEDLEQRARIISYPKNLRGINR